MISIDTGKRILRVVYCYQYMPYLVIATIFITYARGTVLTIHSKLFKLSDTQTYRMLVFSISWANISWLSMFLILYRILP